MAAGSLLLVGGAWAGSIYRSAPAYRGPDTAQLEALAGRLQTSSVATLEALPDPPVVSAPRRVVTPAAPARVAVAPVVAAPRVNAPVLPPAGSAPSAAPAPVVVPAKPAESPVKSLALMGLTHRGKEDTAWLVDISNMERETAEVGDRAFGFTVKEIGAETVLLSRNGTEYELRLGEKSIPTPPSQVVAMNDGSGFGEAGDFGNGGMGRRGRGQGRQSGFSGFGGQGRGSSRSGFGGGRGSFGSTGSAPSFGSSNNSSGFGGNRGNRQSSNSGSSFGGNRGGSSFGGNRGSTGFSGGTGGRNFGGSSSMTSQFAAGGTTASTSNPQTARRRGSRLSGDTPAQPTPQAIANPQTQRRIGTSSGTAFGQAGTTGRTGMQR
jgi:hypothetical protein